MRIQSDPLRAPARRVCIITPGNLSSMPRAVKEADALQAAGLQVHVVFSQGGNADRRGHDEILLAPKPWTWSTVQWSRRPSDARVWWVSGIRQRLFDRLPRASWT